MMMYSRVILSSIYLSCFTQAKQTLFEDDACINIDGTKGFCKRLDSCITGQMSLKAGRAPTICSFIGNHPVVCCPLIELTTRIPPTEDQFLTTSNIPFTTSNIPFTTSNIPLSTSNAPLSTSNIPLSTSNIPLSTSNIPLSTSNIPLSTSNIPLSTSNIPLSTSNIPLITSNIPLTTSNIPLTTSNIPLTTSNIWKPPVESSKWKPPVDSSKWKPPVDSSKWRPEQSFDVSTRPPVISSRMSPVQIAKQKCAEYAKDIIMELDSPVLTSAGQGRKEIIDTCARVEEPLVVGGENAKAREYPHMALIGYRERNPEWLCGGSLISERFVLSAAHCSRPASKGPALWVKLGELDTSTDNDDAKPEVIRIISRIDHPKYSSVTLYNDLSLFKLEKAVTIGPYIRPICLATSQNIRQEKGIATGWGHTAWGGTPSPSLMKVKLNLVTNEECNEAFKKSRGRQIPRGILGDSQICAGDEAGKDTCQGDSGGPLQVPIKDPYCMYELIGITSFGKSCGNGFPGVYTRVSNFLPWIVKNVWPQP